MRRRVSLELLLFFFAWNLMYSRAWADECVSQGKIRFREAAQVRVEAASYCFGEDAESIRSTDCTEGGRCGLQKAILTRSLNKAPLPETGSGLCEQVGAVHQRIEFEVHGRWYEVCRCYFEKDRSFLDVTQTREFHRLKLTSGVPLPPRSR